MGYSSHDIISTMFRVTKTIETLSEHSKLEFIKASPPHNRLHKYKIQLVSCCHPVGLSSRTDYGILSTGDRLCPHAHPRGCPDLAAALWLRGSAVQDQHAAEAVLTTCLSIDFPFLCV